MPGASAKQWIEPDAVGTVQWQEPPSLAGRHCAPFLAHNEIVMRGGHIVRRFLQSAAVVLADPGLFAADRGGR
jgi:hypothetical protein